MLAVCILAGVANASRLQVNAALVSDYFRLNGRRPGRK